MKHTMVVGAFIVLQTVLFKYMITVDVSGVVMVWTFIDMESQ